LIVEFRGSPFSSTHCDIHRITRRLNTTHDTGTHRPFSVAPSIPSTTGICARRSSCGSR
jgi:hypothetical protein